MIPPFSVSGDLNYRVWDEHRNRDKADEEKMGQNRKIVLVQGFGGGRNGRGGVCRSCGTASAYLESIAGMGYGLVIGGGSYDAGLLLGMPRRLCCQDRCEEAQLACGHS